LCGYLTVGTRGFSAAPKLGKPRRFFEDLARSAVTQGLAQSLVVVEIEVGGDAMPCLGYVLVSLQIYSYVFAVLGWLPSVNSHSGSAY
jgi:hypothetical protein